MAEVVDPSILLADYQAKVERLIPASASVDPERRHKTSAWRTA
jgi:hypothetical protein